MHFLISISPSLYRAAHMISMFQTRKLKFCEAKKITPKVTKRTEAELRFKPTPVRLHAPFPSTPPRRLPEGRSLVCELRTGSHMLTQPCDLGGGPGTHSPRPCYDGQLRRIRTTKGLEFSGCVYTSPFQFPSIHYLPATTTAYSISDK